MERALLVVVTLGLLGCAKTKPNDLPAEAWDVADYAKAGLVIDKPWHPDDLTTAATVLKEQCSDHRERLPHFRGAKSGPVFAKLLAPLADARAASTSDQFAVHAQRGEALNQLSKLYTENLLAAPSREFIEVMGTYLGEAATLAVTADAFVATFGSDDPKHRARLDGLAQMKHGYGEMLRGGLLIAEDTRVPEQDRRAMLGYVSAVMPKLLPFADPATQQTIRDNLAKQAETQGPLHEGFVAVQQALTHS